MAPPRAASAPPATVTQRVPPESVDDLVTRPARAALAVAGPDGPECIPVLVHRDDDGLRIGVRPDAAAAVDLLGTPLRGTVAADDGRWWYQLRAVVWRGVLAPAGEADGLRWFRLEPRAVAAWDYGQLHEVEPGGATA